MATNAALISAQDELLRLTGSTGNPFETVTTAGNGTGAYFGADRTIRFYLLIAGAVTGTTPTLTVKFQDSADGSSYTDNGYTFAAQSTTMAAATGSLADLPSVAVMTTPGRPYLRIVKSTGGTSPSFGSVAVLHSPPSGGW
jgi:hypothetical protein